MPSPSTRSDSGTTPPTSNADAGGQGPGPADSGPPALDAGMGDAGPSSPPPADAGTDATDSIDASALRNCAPHPSACGYPDETNTGVPAGTTLTPSGSLEVTQDNAVISGLEIDGGIDIMASNVTIRNVKVTQGGEGDFIISIRPGAQNTLIEDSTIAGLDNGTNGVAMGIFDMSGQGTTLRRNNLYYCAECINGTSPDIEDNYIHDLAFWTSASEGPTHNEDIYFPCGGNGNVTIRHNTMFNQIDQTATVYTDMNEGVCANMTIDDNLVAGGGWTFYMPTGSMRGSGFSYVHNRFARSYFPNSGSYGALGGGSFTASDPGNFWDDTGASVQ